MFCPNCRVEYRQGYTKCADCNVPLVDELPPEPEMQVEYVELVTVLRTGSPLVIELARSILEEAGIHCFAKGLGLIGMWGGGPAGAGFNALMGAAEIQVRQEDVEKAMELLETIREDSSDDTK